MHLPVRLRSPCPRCALRGWKSGALALALLAIASGAQAQDVPPNPPASESEADAPVAFEADGLSYDDASDSVTAFGNVVMRRGDQSVRADKVVWNRKTGEVEASGSIRLVDADGNQLFADSLMLDDELRAGAMQNMLLALREGGRLAAANGSRAPDGTVVLSNAVYSACAVEDSAGCPVTPSWRITAERVTYDDTKKLIRFKGARLELFGARLLPMPGLVLTSDGRPISGLLIPDVRLSASNGVEFSQTYYKRLGNNRDLALTGYVYTAALPMISGQYRQLTSMGAYQITGYATRSSRIPIGGAAAGSQRDFRGYLAGNGRFQLSPNWSIMASGRVASDRTFLRRYDISRDDRLRSVIEAERIDPNSYLSIAGWATQTLRVGDAQGQVPVALPVIDYRRRLPDAVLGGKIELQANSMAITRTTGQDTQRAFAQARWDMRRITGLGQEVTFTALARGDVYNSDENNLTATAVYRGNPGWQTRGLATAAMDVKWPLLGEFLGGTQVLTPRFQVVASPNLRNLAIPNEDARAIDLEDSNLFALNRFPGYDRIEDGVRFTYGFDWQWERPGWRVSTTIGQSYRLTSKPTLLPDGTGLSSRSSDIVGRTEIRFKDFVRLTHRFRLDKDNFAVRRNEIDAAIGNERTYAEIGYLRLNRNIAAIAEDLKDREELRVAGRVAFARYWSVFGSGVFNLTGKNEDPTLTTDGFQALRTRLGVAYDDDCLQLALTWRRDFVATGDARRGNTFQVSIAVRNLGFR
ncbi:LPS-assembly protein LptD [Novosphingobium ginsenosidimutans]|uniref:LPS-assembly protein LptD n=1 Tax=Novosphingobium ginsenosidimutans TaxID=1176536 RepID=A0A5B8S124_9SPHN|nr:LPS assembly protein LptD [Novosphingobium ginsenosidimutans]QEA14772.1 LPS-assembly protein LptD [Novosphingobium ginsenosidimutans]